MGRKSNAQRPKRAELDVTIGRTAQRLMLWGVHDDASRDAIAASPVLARRLEAIDDAPIGSEQIGKIHKAWRASERAAYEAGTHQPGSGYLWSWTIASLTRESRMLARPRGPAGQRLSNQQLADILLDNGGNWPKSGKSVDAESWPFDGSEPAVGLGDLASTKKAQEAFDAAPKIKKRGS